MNLSSDMQKSFVDEIRFVLKNMRNTTVPSQKWYFFSGIFGMAHRILNFECDPELVFVHQVMQLVYNLVNARLTALSTGQESGINIPDNLFTKIEDELDKMATLIEQKKETYPVLQRLINLAYSTTGNGYYLYLKGTLIV